VLYKPWLAEQLFTVLPKTIKRIAVVEQIKRKTTKWGPVLLDLLMSAKASGTAQLPLMIGYQLGYIEYTTITQAIP